MKKIHACTRMKFDAGLPGHKVCTYEWAGESGGWILLTDGVPSTEVKQHRWCSRCLWCDDGLEPIDLLPASNRVGWHRCRTMIVGEFNRNQNAGVTDTPDYVTISWDGFVWNAYLNGDVINYRLKGCPYCTARLPDLRNFRNKVAISSSTGDPEVAVLAVPGSTSEAT